MKKNGSWFMKLILLSFCSSSYSYITIYKAKEKPAIHDTGHHYLIEFTHTPRNEQQRNEWTEAIKRAIDQTQAILIEKNLIAPEHKNQSIKIHSLERAYQAAKEVIYDVFFHTYTLTYPRQFNKPFITRNNQQIGSLGVYLPDGVSPEISLYILRKELKKQGVSVVVIPDCPLEAMLELPTSCSYIAFDYPTYKACKNGTLPKKYRSQLEKINYESSGRIKKYGELQESKKIEKVLELFDKINPQLGWHQSFPTTGIALNSSEWKHNYPFLPHQFPLWQMAPKLGAGITIAFIDTGIASFSIDQSEKKKNKSMLALRKNKNLTTSVDYSQMNTNLVGADGLNQFDELINCIEPYLLKPFNRADLETYVIGWIEEYLENNTTDAMIDYLHKKGVKELFDTTSKTMSTTGKIFLQKIMKLMDQFHLVTVTDGTQKPQKVLLECLPLSPLVPDKYKTLMMGHGSHAVGLAAGKLENYATSNNNYEPSEQESIYGIAPQADVVMIKAFSDTAATYQSTMLAGLLKAINSKAQIVNMSLKIADFLDKTTDYSKSLAIALEKIPYCVAASGNDGDPKKQGHAGPGLQVEAYPARFDGIAFDVGAFSYNHVTGMCPIPPFSQYQLSAHDPHHKEKAVSIGPKFVAPGYNIISSGLVPDQKDESAAVMMHGTSTAAPQISGFLALMLSEFQDEFTREQYLKVCYSSGIQLMDSTQWRQRSIFGALDMRTALFTLHVLRSIKNSSEKDRYYVKNNFDHCVALIHQLLFGMVDTTFKKDFCHFYKHVQQQAEKGITADLSNPIFHDFKKAVTFCAQKVIAQITLLSENQTTHKKQLFDGLHPAAHNRVQTALKNTSK